MTTLSGNELWKRYGERDVVQGVDVEALFAELPPE